MHPSIIGLSPQKPDHTSAMDPEADRCRRTDGKKWRCSKKAIPNEKYCEGHMHRGCNRGSRKLVEPKKIIPKPDNKTHVHSMVPISSVLGQSQPVINEESSSENANPRKIEYGTAKNNHPEFGSSPKSVLHCGAGEDYLGPKNVTENVPQRCKRTDGKKWQCGQEALPDEKYCQRHMHRGAKRVMSNPLSPPLRKARTSCTIITSLDNNINANTIQTSPQLVCDNNDSMSSGSSRAYTISD
ncbi:hypothetical protein CASFOL_039971 [Castilleja foliolosa]|uniref:Growth-regulating factor n=1 Tax=Castilleja foliolosa TaxID=1961234 RepID=A0ABD3BGP2_9LAMI